jgi:hypothetical protein
MKKEVNRKKFSKNGTRIILKEMEERYARSRKRRQPNTHIIEELRCTDNDNDDYDDVHIQSHESPKSHREIMDYYPGNIIQTEAL